MRILLVLHAILLLLASTGFTVVTAFLGNASFQWCYLKYSSRAGFGVEYVSEFSALEIATYLIAFAIGVLGFFIALKNGRPAVGGLGVLLSLIGFLSFAIEGSHWIVDHNRSWLAFSPAFMFVLVILACLPKRLSNDANGSSGTSPNSV